MTNRPDIENPNNQSIVELTQSLYHRQQQAYNGGSAAAIDRHRQRGKWLVRESIAYLLDDNSPFLELGALAGDGLYDHPLPAAGLVIGIGYVNQRAVMIVANDATVKAGCYFPITVKKHRRALAVAEQLGLTVVHIVDSGGAYLPLQDEIFPDHDGFGSIFYQQARLSRRGLRQLAVVMGSCAAGGAYIPAMCDELVMLRRQGYMALASPQLVQAATGEVVSAEALGGASMHAQVSGVADDMVDTPKQALDWVKRRLSWGAGRENKSGLLDRLTQEALPDDPEISRLIPEDSRHIMPADQLVEHVVDLGSMTPFKPCFGVTLVTAFAEIAGFPVGIIVNQGVLLADAALKATQFIQLCEREQRPLIFLHNVTGFMVGEQAERQGIIKQGAKMVMAMANASVPKISVVVGGSYGAGHYAMCGRAFQPDFLWAWPNARVAVMGGEQAGFVMESLGLSPDELAAMRARYEESAQAFYGSARLWDDGIIDPASTRRILAWSLAAVASGVRAPQDRERWGLFRH